MVQCLQTKQQSLIGWTVCQCLTASLIEVGWVGNFARYRMAVSTRLDPCSSQIRYLVSDV